MLRNITSASPSPPREGVFGERDMYKTRNIPSKYDEEMPESSNKGENDKFDRKQLAKIKIVTPNVAYSKDEVDINRRKRLEKGICTLEKVLQYTEDGRISSKSATRFNSQEFETPSIKELKKIQVVKINNTQLSLKIFKYSTRYDLFWKYDLKTNLD